MTVRMLPIDDFYALFPVATTVYSSRDFICLNKDKAECVRCFAGYDGHGKARLGIVMGFKNGEWRAPFSAPFADFAYNKQESLEGIYDFVSELADMLSGHSIKITLSAPLYDIEMWNHLSGVLANFADKTIWDYNYHYSLSDFDGYRERLASEPRRKLKQAAAQGFDFFKTEDGTAAYQLIAAHHRQQGYAMAMTYEQVLATAQVVPTDFFMLRLGDELVAAAYCQHVAHGCVQLINWGDCREYSSARPMNWMAYKLCEHYARLGYRIFDFGPSSTAGIPNGPLCSFKQSIGCSLTLKPTFLIGG